MRKLLLAVATLLTLGFGVYSISAYNDERTHENNYEYIDDYGSTYRHKHRQHEKHRTYQKEKNQRDSEPGQPNEDKENRRGKDLQKNRHYNKDHSEDRHKHHFNNGHKSNHHCLY